MLSNRRSFLASCAALLTAPLVAMGVKKRERFSIAEHARKTPPRGTALLQKQREWNARCRVDKATIWDMFDATDFSAYRNLKGSMHDVLRDL